MSFQLQVFSFVLKSSRRFSRIPKCEREKFIAEIEKEKLKVIKVSWKITLQYFTNLTVILTEKGKIFEFLNLKFIILNLPIFCLYKNDNSNLQCTGMEVENSIIELKGTNETIFYFHLLAFQPAENKHFICSNIPGVCFLPIHRSPGYRQCLPSPNVHLF